jgi:hypothetical protein
MIKIFIVGCLVFGLVWLLQIGNITGLLTSNTTFYIVLGMVVSLLIAAFIILGNPFTVKGSNDKKDN